MSDALKLELWDAQNIVTKIVIRQILNFRWKNCLLEGHVWFNLNRQIRNSHLLLKPYLM